MTDRDSLLAAVLNTPADDTARLVFADFLEENGEPNLGRFLRAGVMTSRFSDRDPEPHERALHDTALAEVAAQVAAGTPVAWVAALGLGPRPLTPGDGRAEHVVDDRVTVRIGPATGEFLWGMLEGLALTLGEWYEVAGRALAAWPVERVSVRDVPGLGFYVEPPTEDRAAWWLSEALTVYPGRPALSCPRGLWGRLVAAFATPTPPAGYPPRRRGTRSSGPNEPLRAEAPVVGHPEAQELGCRIVGHTHALPSTACRSRRPPPPGSLSGSARPRPSTSPARSPSARRPPRPRSRGSRTCSPAPSSGRRRSGR